MPASSTRAPSGPKSKGGNALFALVIVGLLVVGGGIFALFFFLGESPRADDEMLAYLPADTSFIIAVDVEELKKAEKSRTWTTSLSQLDPAIIDLLTRGGLSLSTDVSHVVVGVRELKISAPRIAPPRMGTGGMNTKANLPVATPNAEPDHASSVLRMKQGVDKAKLVAAWSAIELKKGDKSYYLIPSHTADAALKCFFPPKDTLIVFTRNDKVLEKILAADPGKPSISEEMQYVARRVSKGPVWFAMSRRALPERMYIDIKGDGACPYLTTDTVEALKNTETAGGWLKLEDDRVEMTISLTCTESAIAGRAAEKLKQLFADNRTTDLNSNSSIADYKKKNGTMMISPAVWDACGEIQRTAKVDFSNYALEVTASFAADDLTPLIVEITTMRLDKPADPFPTLPSGLPVGGPKTPIGKIPGKK